MPVLKVVFNNWDFSFLEALTAHRSAGVPQVFNLNRLFIVKQELGKKKVILFQFKQLCRGFSGKADPAIRRM